MIAWLLGRRTPAARAYKMFARMRILVSLLMAGQILTYILPVILGILVAAPAFIFFLDIGSLVSNPLAEQQAKINQYQQAQAGQSTKVIIPSAVDVSQYASNAAAVSSIAKIIGSPIKESTSKITSVFGYRAISIDTGFHAGIDYSGNKDKTPIYAAADGHVIHAGWIEGYGYTVVIRHDFSDNGKNYVFYSYSAHISNTNFIYVAKGDSVSRGQEIAKLGHSGMSTGPHLHFELRLPWGNNPGQYDAIAMGNYRRTGKTSALINPVDVLGCDVSKVKNMVTYSAVCEIK